MRKRTRDDGAAGDAGDGLEPAGGNVDHDPGLRLLHGQTPVSSAQVTSAIVPCPQAVEYPALWKKTTPRSAPSSSGSVTKHPYMSACPRGSNTSSRRTWSSCSAAKRRFSRIVPPPSEGTPPVTILNGSPAVW